jgi:hypothetical protein
MSNHEGCRKANPIQFDIHYSLFIIRNSFFSFGRKVPTRKPMDMTDDETVVHVPIDGVLDLHMFSPREAASVVEEYIRACLAEGISEVRIIHGKGTGALRRTVHALLDRHPRVDAYGLDTGPSGWGATQVSLKKNIE